MIILYAFLSQLRRSWFSSVCVSVCLYARACESVEVLPGSGSFPFSLSLSLSPLTLPFPFSVFNGLLFSATTRCTVQSVSLTKHDQNNKKKIINANLPNSAFVFFLFAVQFFYGLLFCFCLCVNVTLLTLLSLCCTVLNGPYLSFFLFY